MQEFVLKYGVQTLLGGVVAYLTAVFRKFSKQRECDQLQLKATQAGVRALLKERLVESIHKAKQQGFVYIFQLESINSMFEEYTNLGGNGTIKHMMKELSELPTKTSIK